MSHAMAIPAILGSKSNDNLALLMAREPSIILRSFLDIDNTTDDETGIRSSGGNQWYELSSNIL
jgi:hypothetical protein